MRCVGSMTTLPKRLPKIRKIIQSVLKTGLDVLYLNIPYETRKGEKYRIPEFLKDMENVKIIRCEDYGPITKILPVLDVENDPETAIITFDDDMLVHKDVVSILRRKSRKYPQSCVGFSGACAGKFPFVYHWSNSNRVDQRVDWLEGVHCVLYKRKFLDKEEILNFGKPIQDLLIKNDDHWLSGYLGSKKIPRISIGYNPETYFQETSLKGINSLSGRHVKLYWEHIRIMQYLSRRGIYNQQQDWVCSMGFIFVCLVSILLAIKPRYLVCFWLVLVVVNLVWIKY